MLPKSINIARRYKNTGRSLISFSLLSILCATSHLNDSFSNRYLNTTCAKTITIPACHYDVLHDAPAVAPHHIKQDHAYESSISISFFFKLIYSCIFVNMSVRAFFTPPLPQPQTASRPRSSLYRYRRAFWT